MRQQSSADYRRLKQGRNSILTGFMNRLRPSTRGIEVTSDRMDGARSGTSSGCGVRGRRARAMMKGEIGSGAGGQWWQAVDRLAGSGVREHSEGSQKAY